MLCFLPFFRLLCRLTYALCLNFLAIIHLDGHVTEAVEKVETSFTKVKILLSLYLVNSINIITGIWTLFEHIRLSFSFQISLRWLTYIVNSVDKTKLSFSITVCLFSWLFVHGYFVSILIKKKNCGATQDSVSLAIQTTWISSKILLCVSYILLFSWCLDILMKHCFLCWYKLHDLGALVCRVLGYFILFFEGYHLSQQ